MRINLRYGREFDEGWYNLFELLLTELEPYDIEITVAKQKFGLLRVYSSFCPTEAKKIIHKYEELSSKICEVCGAEGSTYIINNCTYKTICKNHVNHFSSLGAGIKALTPSTK